MMQMGPRGAIDAGEMYSPGRDIIHILPGWLEAVWSRERSAKSLGCLSELLVLVPAHPDRPWENDPSSEQFWEALQIASSTYWKMLEMSLARPDLSFSKLMVESGWEALPVIPRVTLMHYLGCLCSGCFVTQAIAMGYNSTLAKSLNYFRDLMRVRPEIAGMFCGQPGDLKPMEIVFPPSKTN